MSIKRDASADDRGADREKLADFPVTLKEGAA
jgi:hypothetical protein